MSRRVRPLRAAGLGTGDATYAFLVRSEVYDLAGVDCKVVGKHGKKRVRGIDNRGASCAAESWVSGVRVLAGLILALSASAAPAGPSPAGGAGVAASVNGVSIQKQTLSDVVGAVIARSVDPPDSAQAAELRKQALDSLIAFELLYQESQARQLTPDDDSVAKAIQDVAAKFESPKAYRAALRAQKTTPADVERETRKMLAVNRVLDEVVWKDVRVDEGAVRAFYEENAQQFVRPEAIRIRQVLVRASPGSPSAGRDTGRAKAQEVVRRLREGEEFAAVARAESDDAMSAARGGDMGYLSRGTMPQAFEDAAFRLQPGEVSDVVETQFGFHVLSVTDRRAEGIALLEEVRARIVAVLTEEQRQQRQDAFVEALRRKATIEIAPELQ